MSLFRKVYTEFWKDTKVLEELTPEDKLFFLYLLTNPNTNLLGIYKITKKQIAFEIGYSVEAVSSLIERFENKYKMIRYNTETKEIGVLNWGRYNLNAGGKPVVDCINKELKGVKDKTLIRELLLSVDKQSMKDLIENYLKEMDGIEKDMLSDKAVEANDDTQKDTLYHKSVESSNVSSLELGREKEIEKELELEKKKEIELEKKKEIELELESESEKKVTATSITEYISIYESNIKKVDNKVNNWLVEIQSLCDIGLFERAIEISKQRGKLNKAYINAIIRNWNEAGIHTYTELMKKGEDYESNRRSYKNYEHTKELQNKDKLLYEKPTEEDLRRISSL